MNDSESKVRHGFFWLGTASAALRAFDLLSSFVVLWFLTSEQMGLASLSWSIAIVIESFNGLGVGLALVQSESVDEDDLASLFWFTLGFGALFSAGIALASPLIAGAFAARALAPMICVAGLRLLFMSAALVPLQLVNRRLEFQRVALVQTVAAGGAAIVKVSLAALGFGAWALVIAHSSEALFTVLTLYSVAPFWPKRRFAWKRVARFVRFGLKAAGSSVVYQMYRNLDFVLVGRAFGMATLGAYRVAFDVAMVPAMALLDVVNRTAFPIYSRIGVRDQPRLKRIFLWMTRVQALLSGPIMVLLFFFGTEILVTVTGEKWRLSGPMITVLCWAGFLRTLTQAIPQLFHAAGRPELALYDSLLTLPCFVLFGWGLVFWLGPALGANAVSLAWVLTYLFMLVVLRRMARSIIDLSLVEYVKNLAHPIAIMALMFGVLAAAMPTLRSVCGVFVATGIGIALGVLLAGAYCRIVLGMRLSDLLPRNAAPKAVSSE